MRQFEAVLKLEIIEIVDLLRLFLVLVPELNFLVFLLLHCIRFIEVINFSCGLGVPVLLNNWAAIIFAAGQIGRCGSLAGELVQIVQLSLQGGLVEPRLP